MIKLFNKNKYHIKLYINRIEIKNLISGKSISENSEIKFNNERLLIAEFEKAENFIKKTFKRHEFSTRNSIGIIQQIDMSEGGLSEVEQRVLLELFSGLGISEIHIVKSSLNLTETQLATY